MRGSIDERGPCPLTDLELSGAPQLATREADRGRPTRPLERLVRPQGNHVEKASTKLTERRCSPKSELRAKDRASEVNAGGPRSPDRVRTPGTLRGARAAAEGKEPRPATKAPSVDANRKKSCGGEAADVRSNGSGAERRATMLNRRSRIAGAQRVRSSDWLAGEPRKSQLVAWPDLSFLRGQSH